MVPRRREDVSPLRPGQRLQRRPPRRRRDRRPERPANFVTGRGAITTEKDNAGDKANTFDITRGVTHFDGLSIAPSDTFLMHGFTQADIANAFAHIDRAGRTTETLTFSHPGGRSVSFGFSSEYGQVPTMAQVHPA